MSSAELSRHRIVDVMLHYHQLQVKFANQSLTGKWIRDYLCATDAQSYAHLI